MNIEDIKNAKKLAIKEKAALLPAKLPDSPFGATMEKIVIFTPDYQTSISDADVVENSLIEIKEPWIFYPKQILGHFTDDSTKVTLFFIALPDQSTLDDIRLC
jgi:hypothetical protein